MSKRTKLFSSNYSLVAATLFPLILPLTIPAIAAQSDVKDDTVIDAQGVPTFTGAYLSGQIADFDNDIDLAIEFYQRALEFAPDNVDAKRRLFTTLILAGQFDDAAKFAVKLQDDADVAQLAARTLAVSSIQKREYRRAESFLELEEYNPVDSMLNNLLSAWAKFGNNKSEEAFLQIENLEGPDWYSAFQDYNLALMAIAAGEPEKAHRHFDSLIANEDALQIMPDAYLQSVMAQASLYFDQGEKQKALGTLTGNIVAAYPPAGALEAQIRQDLEVSLPVSNAQAGASAALFAVGSALNREGNEDIVALYLQFARALDPENAAALVMLAGLKEQLNQPEKAISIYRNVPETSPMKRLSELQLGLNLADIGQTDEALHHIGTLIETYPKDIRAYTSYGSILSQEKRYREMVDNYEAAINVFGPIHRPSQWNLFYQLGIGYERLKIWDKAEKAFLRALELSPQQPQVMNYLGYSWIDMNINLDRGIEMIKAAVDLRPNDGYIVDSLGWAYYRQGRYEEAVTELERAVELRPSDPTINDHLGDAFWQVGRKVEARFQWERALTRMAEFDESLIPVIKHKIEHGLTEEAGKQDG